VKCAVEMGSGAMIYTPGFVNIGSGIEKLMARFTDIKIHAHRQLGDRVSIHSFFSK
jgi:hypothetical protein